MKLIDYVKDKLIFISIQLAALIFACFFMILFDLNIYATILIMIILVISVLVSFFSEYFRRYTFYQTISLNIDALDKKHLISELIEEPEFSEGRLLYYVISKCNKSMNDEIAFYKNSSNEYREYIETWVHEIKTPISASKLIIENNKNAVTNELDFELTRIDNYVEQALYYCRSNNIEKDYLIKEIDLSDIVKASIRKHSKLLIESKTTINLENFDFRVFTDVKWIDFILGQIIINAQKYKSNLPIIAISAEEYANSVILKIRDNGIGIPQGDLNRVFDKGFTGQNGRNHSKSTGIGLYLCKKLCLKMGLNIFITSELNEWTEVRIVFPTDNFQFYN